VKTHEPATACQKKGKKSGKVRVRRGREISQKGPAYQTGGGNRKGTTEGDSAKNWGEAFEKKRRQGGEGVGIHLLRCLRDGRLTEIESGGMPPDNCWGGLAHMRNMCRVRVSTSLQSQRPSPGGGSLHGGGGGLVWELYGRKLGRKSRTFRVF